MKLFPTKGLKPISLLGGILGALLAWYCGLVFFIPATFILIIAYVSYKNRPAIDENIHAVSGIHAGHALWTLIGMIMAARFPQLNIIDASVLMVSVFFLRWKPGLPLFILLAGYQIIALKMTGNIMQEMEFGSGIHRAHILHLALRVISLFILFKIIIRTLIAKRMATSHPQAEH